MMHVSKESLFTIMFLIGSGTGKQLLANYSGDIVLGALFPIHADTGTPNTCGRIQDQDGIQMLEAMMFALDHIKDTNFLPGFTLGMLAVDSCDSDTRALERAVEFVKVLTLNYHRADDSPLVCSDGTEPKRKIATEFFENIVGVVGASSSKVSVQVASFLRLFKVPQVSYLSTSPELSNKERYDYFLRTVPSDKYQARAIVDILIDMSWTYVSILYDDTSYGIQGYGEVRKLAKRAGICFAITEKLQTFRSDTNLDRNEMMDAVVESLLTKPNAKAVIIYADYTSVPLLFAAVKRRGLHNKFMWIGSDGWSGRDVVVRGQEDVVNHAITVQPLANRLQGFDSYFTSLRPFSNVRDPWFMEFWEDHFRCRFITGPVTEYNENYTIPCINNEQLSKASGYRQQMNAYYVFDAVYAFAHALRNMHSDRCGGGTRGLCDAMKPSNISGTDLRHYLRNVSFTDANGLQFYFLNGVDGPPRYSILTFRKVNNYYEWVEIGNWTEEIDGNFNIHGPFRHVKMFYEPSICSRPCGLGMAKKLIENEQCCWICTNCTEFQYLVTPDECADCPYGSVPVANWSTCAPLAENFMFYDDTLGIAVSIVATIGVIATFAIAVAYHHKKSTPIIKASGTELGFILLCGIALSYLSTFVFLLKPSPITCGLTRCLLGMCFTICYVAIFTKTNRIARIFQSSPEKLRYTSPRSQLVITFLLSGVEVAILIVWIVIRIPETMHVYPTKMEKVLVCSDSVDASYLITLVYPCLLVVLCTVYAVKTRNTPDGFNETRCIAFCAYTTVIIWLAFMPIYFASIYNSIKVTTLCLTLSANGTISIACLFLPKLYLVYFKPEKNTKESVMSGKKSFSTSSRDSTLDENTVIRKHEQDSSVSISDMAREGDQSGLPNAIVPQRERDLSAHDRNLDAPVDTPMYSGQFIDDHVSRSVQVHNDPKTEELQNESIAL